MDEFVCRNCEKPIDEADAFCKHCGTRQQVAPPSKHGRLRKVVYALVVLIVLGGIGLAAHKYFLRDISWPDVLAMVMRRERIQIPPQNTSPARITLWTPDGEAPEGASNTQVIEYPLPQESRTAEEPPVIQAGPDVPYAPNSPDIIPAAPVSPWPIEPESAWSQQDANGYSFPVESDSVGTLAQASSFTGVILGNRVRLRSEPNTKSQILDMFDKGETFKVTQRYSSGEEKYFWFKVSNLRKAGWVYGEFLDVTTDTEQTYGNLTSSAVPLPANDAKTGERPAIEPDRPETPSVISQNGEKIDRLMKEGRTFWLKKDWPKAYERFDEAYKLRPTAELKMFRDNARGNMNAEKTREQASSQEQTQRRRQTAHTPANYEGRWSVGKGMIEDTNGCLYNLTDGNLNISMNSPKDGNSLILTLNGVFSWKWDSQNGDHVYPNPAKSEINRKNVVFMEVEEGLYHASGAEWPPTMYFKA
ncbi:MAG: SH3 domain-containing protein, partial [Synergistaceae bacterium]|nr:SH3 domain-containing protein [Synergistaceae bacterium]